MIDRAAGVRAAHTVITADAGYHSNEDLTALCERALPALIADTQMRRRDERFAGQKHHKARPDPLHDKRAGAGQHTVRLYRPADFAFDAQTNSCVCPGGRRLYSNGSHCKHNGRIAHKFSGTRAGCRDCKLRAQCLRHPERAPARQVSMFALGQPAANTATQLMKQAIDSARGRRMYSQRIATVEPVFANIRPNKRMNRFTLRGCTKVGTQWQLHCLVHDIEKLAHHGYR